MFIPAGSIVEAFAAEILLSSPFDVHAITRERRTAIPFTVLCMAEPYHKLSRTRLLEASFERPEANLLYGVEIERQNC
jgi:hypothetical protein